MARAARLGGAPAAVAATIAVAWAGFSLPPPQLLLDPPPPG